MAEVLLEQPFISHQDIDNCIRTFKTIEVSKTDPTLKVIARSKLVDIDILLPAYLMLFKKEWPELKIEIILPHNDEQEKDKAVGFKLRQFGTYCYLMTGLDVYSFTIGGIRFRHDFSDKTTFPERSFVLSGNFMLLLGISEEEPGIYDLLFEKNPAENDPCWFLPPFPLVQHKTSDDTYQYYKTKITSIANPKNREQAVRCLGSIAFLRSLHKAYIASYYVGSFQVSAPALEASGMHAGTLSASKESNINRAFEYYKKVRNILDELRTKPLVYHFIFSQLLVSGILPNLTIETENKFISTLHSLWKFTKVLSTCLKELAKNILQHASPKSGAICAKINPKKLVPLLLNSGEETSTIYAQYLSELSPEVPEPVKALLDIHILDLGNKGVAQTLLNKTEEMAEEIGHKHNFYSLLQEDITNLKSGNTTLLNFLSNNEHPPLNQQSKKSIAHFGLMTFSKLITTNKGLIIASSQSTANKRETVVVPKFDKILGHHVSYGTRYSIILPIFENQPYIPHSRVDMEIPVESSQAEMKGLESLSRIKEIIPGKPRSKDQGSDIYLKTIIPSHVPLNNRDDEKALWNTIKHEIIEVIEGVESQWQTIVNLDLRLLPINSSQLLRLLAMLETEYPLITTLVSNIAYDTFNELTELNSFFFKQNPDMPFWSDQNVIIFYHYISTGKNEPFYFTDGLWGKTKEQFLYLNKLIHRNHFNATTILNLSNGIRPPQRSSGLFSLERNLAFYNKNVLLPFDLLIKGRDDNSIFEHNALLLLQNIIKPNTIL